MDMFKMLDDLIKRPKILKEEDLILLSAEEKRKTITKCLIELGFFKDEKNTLDKNNPVYSKYKIIDSYSYYWKIIQNVNSDEYVMYILINAYKLGKKEIFKATTNYEDMYDKRLSLIGQEPLNHKSDKYNLFWMTYAETNKQIIQAINKFYNILYKSK